MRGSWSGTAKSCFCVSPFLLLRRDSSSMPEQILVRRQRPTQRAPIYMRRKALSLSLGSTRKPKGFETAVHSRFLDFYQEPRNQSVLQRTDPSRCCPVCTPHSNSQANPLNPTNHLFSIGRVAVYWRLQSHL